MTETDTDTNSLKVKASRRNARDRFKRHYRERSQFEEKLKSASPEQKNMFKIPHFEELIKSLEEKAKFEEKKTIKPRT